MPDFYCFNNLTHLKQPKNSSWCWAYCLEKMINGLGSNSEIGTKICELVSYYKSYKEGTPHANKKCCDSGNNCINIGLKTDHLEEIFDKAGFTASIVDKSILNSYEDIVNNIMTNQSPLVLKTKRNTAHMELIIGFGELNGCQYLLISDPTNYSDVQYLSFQELNLKAEIIWETELKDIEKTDLHNIEKDQLIEANYSTIQDYIENNIDKINSIDPALTDPWILMNMPFDKSLIKIKDQSDILSFMSYKFNERNDYMCHPINRCSRPIRAITNGRIILNRAGCLNKKRNEIIFESYATIVKFKKKNNGLYVKPVSFPKDYNLEKKWQTYHQFYNTLKKDNPKIKAFED